MRDRIEERHDGLLSAQDAAQLDAHVRSCAACAQDVLDAQAFASLLLEAGDPGRGDGAVQRLAEALHASDRRRRVGWMWAAAVAALLIVVLTTGSSGNLVRALPADEAVQLQRGERVRVGRAVIESIQTARVVAAGDGRSVRLAAGTARFDVRSGTTPFAVWTPAGVVRVLGTEFEVRVMNKMQWIGAGAVTTVLVTGGLVLMENSAGEVRAPGGTVAIMREGHAPRLMDSEAVTALVEENERLRAQVDALQARDRRGPTLVTDVQKPEPSAPAPDEGSTAPEAVPQDGPADPVQAVIAATDWERMGRAMLVLLDVGESERAPTADEAVERAFVLTSLATLASKMKRRIGPDVLLDGRIRGRFLRSLLAAALPDVEEETRRAVAERVAEAMASADVGADATLLPSERMARRLAAAVRADESVRRSLSSEQSTTILKLLTLLQQDFSRSISTTASNTVESLATSIHQAVVERFQIGPDDRQAVLAHVRRFVTAHLDACRSIQEAYEIGSAHHVVQEPEKLRDTLGAERMQRARLETWERFARHQATMERAIHDEVPPDVQARMRSAENYWWFVRLSPGHDEER